MVMVVMNGLIVVKIKRIMIKPATRNDKRGILVFERVTMINLIEEADKIIRLMLRNKSPVLNGISFSQSMMKETRAKEMYKAALLFLVLKRT